MSISTTAATAAIVDQHDAGDSRDQIIVALVGKGMSLNGATKLYATVSKANGWTVALVSHREAALAYLADAYGVDQWDADAVRDAAIELADRFGVAESTARDYCKAYSESLGVDHPVVDPREAMFSWLVEHAATATKAEFIAYAGPDGLGRSVSNVNEYWKGLELHRAILAAS